MLRHILHATVPIVLWVVSAITTPGCRTPGTEMTNTPLVTNDAVRSAVERAPAAPAESVALPSVAPAASTAAVRPVSHQQPDELAAAAPTPEMLDQHGDAAAPHRVPTSPMTLGNLENLALSNNPVIARAGARISAAQGNWVQTGLPPNPRLGYIAEEMGSAGSAGMQGGFVGQEFITAHKLSLNRQVAAWEIQAAKQDVEAERLRVLTDVRTAYYDTLIAQERRELAANLVGISEQAVQSAELLFKGEEVSEADPLRARVEAEHARIVWENADAQLHETGGGCPP